MYDICTSFLKGELSEYKKKESGDLISDIKFKNLIAEDLSCRGEKHTGCLTCSADYSYVTTTDYRNIIEAECEGLLGRHFCEIKSSNSIAVEKGDYILIRCNEDESIEIARVVETGEIVKVRRKRLGLYEENIPIVIRKLIEHDKMDLNLNRDDELKAKKVFHEEIERLSLEMKLVDVHFQFDRKKLFFFYTADGRVDFRELAKSLASKFRTRIELRQIGVRDEAKRIGGMGTCGREFCCATHLNTFKRITTQIANDQNVSSSMSKLSGPCGKLKCCLSYEIF
ncbi:MAG: hypothetical protein K9J12_06485 [Melioribacteraceae bacterium]|nr:hypothetical protein [Melioribacteraceae bacterium]MCF8265427.1 hypothetical protein [Melioribacteraceae bacterium]MCF8413653.1 hypothetical protein [Melioribacteraceae bacterium]MCF8432121.1 hypothetical protein [Melioribacteraceae bacterium]